MQWYYEEDGRQCGPMDSEGIRALVKTGSIRAESLVWHQGLATWITFAKVDSDGLLEKSSDLSPENLPPIAAPRMAVASLVCGILGLVTCTLFPGLLAILLGRQAMKMIENSAVPIKGAELARGGLVYGYICLAILLVLVLVGGTFAMFVLNHHAHPP